MALIYEKSGEKMIICAVREAHIRQFQATDWVDLRVGSFLSLTKAASDDDPTSLAETISGSTGVPWTDRVQIGLTDRASGTIFAGYTNLPGNRIISIGASSLASSDIGIGTSDAKYWRPKNAASSGDNDTMKIIDGTVVRASGRDGSQIHFVQDPATAGGYCTFFGLRFTRDDAHARAKIITMQIKKTIGGHSSDILFTTTPTNAIAEAQLESFPTDVNTLGPVELSHVPDTFFFYWPFHNSRLRIHEVALVKSA
jgi:hypothetical protein